MLELRINNQKFDQNVTFRKAARALIVHDKKVAILYSKKYRFFMTPGGGIEGNETLEDACIREAKEEAGLEVSPSYQFARIDVNYPHIRIEHNYFICELIESGIDTEYTNLELDQDLELRWVSPKDLGELFSSVSKSEKYDYWMRNEYHVMIELINIVK